MSLPCLIFVLTALFDAKAWYNPRLTNPDVSGYPGCEAGDRAVSHAVVYLKVTKYDRTWRDIGPLYFCSPRANDILESKISNLRVDTDCAKVEYLRPPKDSEIIFGQNFLLTPYYQFTHLANYYRTGQLIDPEELYEDPLETDISVDMLSTCSREGTGDFCAEVCSDDLRNLCDKPLSRQKCQPTWLPLYIRMSRIILGLTQCIPVFGQYYYNTACIYRSFCDINECPGACIWIDNITTICDRYVNITIDYSLVLMTGERVLKCIPTYPPAPFVEVKIQSSHIAYWTWTPSHLAVLHSESTLVMRFIELPQFEAMCGIPNGANAVYRSNGSAYGRPPGKPKIILNMKTTKVHGASGFLKIYLGSSIACVSVMLPEDIHEFEALWFTTDDRAIRDLSNLLDEQILERTGNELRSTLSFPSTTPLGVYEAICSIHPKALRQGIKSRYVNHSMEQVKLLFQIDMIEKFVIEPESNTFLTTNSRISCNYSSPLELSLIMESEDETSFKTIVENPYLIEENVTKPGTYWFTCTLRFHKELRLRLRRYFTIFFPRPTYSNLTLDEMKADCKPPQIIGRPVYEWFVQTTNETRLLPFRVSYIYFSDLVSHLSGNSTSITLGCNVTVQHEHYVGLHFCIERLQTSQMSVKLFVFSSHDELRASYGVTVFLLVLVHSVGVFVTLILVTAAQRLSLRLHVLHMWKKRHQLTRMNDMHDHEMMRIESLYAWIR